MTPGLPDLLQAGPAAAARAGAGSARALRGARRPTARAALLAAGFADGSVTLAGGASGSVQHAVAAPDQSLLGRLREAVLPDDSTTALRDAASNDETVLTLRPEAAQVEDAIRIRTGERGEEAI